jgi:polyisoprenyl-teichoic acid--peptidoglycan teichoic acid transferase
MSAQAKPTRKRKATRPRRSRPLRTLGLWLLAVLLAIPLFGFAAVKGWIPEPVVSAAARLVVGRQPDARPWAPGQPVNVLILGLQIGGASTNPLTDSIMVASYQPDGSVNLLSVPRDLWVEIPGYGEARINEAFQVGGAQEAMLTVQQNLGVPVNYYAIVGYEAFRRTIDNVGGITVEVPEAIDDPTFPADDEIQFEPFHITEGTHHLDGREALRYARTRHADTDFARADRQQQVLMALKQQLMKPASLLKAPLILRDLRATVRTNFPFDQAMTVALRALGGGLDNLHRQVLQPANGAVNGFTTGSGAQVLAPNPKVIGPMVDELFGPSLAILQAEGTVQVDNGNGYKGAATHFTGVLQAMGVKVLEPGDADRKNYPTSLVRVSSRAGRATREKAELIAGLLGAKAAEGSTPDGVDVQVVLGREYAPYIEFREKDWQDAIRPR